MKRESLAFLLGGFAFGILFGFVLFHMIANPPELAAAESGEGGMGATRGPNAPTQVGSTAAGAPMVTRINQLKRELEQDPQNIAAYAELADIYHRAGMFDQAARYYEQALTLEQSHPHLLVNLGLCYQAMQRFDEALETFDRAYELDPSHWQALFNTVVVAGRDLGQYDVAFGALEAIEAIQPPPEGLDGQQLQQLRDWLVTERAAAEDGDTS